MHKKVINLPTNRGKIEDEVLVFDKSDKKHLKEIYAKWVDLDEELRRIGARRPLFPIEIIEGIVCIDLNMFKVVTNKVCYDLYDPMASPKKDDGKICVKVALNSAYRMQLNDMELADSDRIIFVKLFIEDRNSSEYEIYEFKTHNIKQYLSDNNQFGISGNIRLSRNIRFSISYKEFVRIPHEIIKKENF